MKVASFAPHLSGRMLPALFSAAPGQRKPRFPGDPWAAQPHWAAFHWMHTTACTKDERGCLHGLCRSWTIPCALRDHELERRNSQQVLKVERASADATGCERSAITSPDVGPMGAGQPADAGPVAGQRELFAEVAA
jgi:hypothetical protein